jgi:hypothetical protein
MAQAGKHGFLPLMQPPGWSAAGAGGGLDQRGQEDAGERNHSGGAAASNGVHERVQDRHADPGGGRRVVQERA